MKTSDRELLQHILLEVERIRKRSEFAVESGLPDDQDEQLRVINYYAVKVSGAIRKQLNGEMK
jgi:hypothetical protein